ncbi:MAG: A24 family peptidase [Desulfovibrio sp.]|nr:A24 family peptidase [Desulfovibrio sp.]
MSLPLFFRLISGAALGAVFGSFFSAAAWARLTGSPFWRKRSVCDRCGSRLTPLALLPILGFIFLGGKCRSCGRPIPPFHLLMELIPATVGAALAWRYDITWLAICYIILATALIAACAIDCLTRSLPDLFTLGGYLLLPPILLLNTALTPISSFLGFIFGGGGALSIYLFFKYVRKKEALGLGDVKLFALAGAFCGASAVPCLYLISACGGIAAFLCLLPWQKGDIWLYRLPFGPFIGAAFLALLVFPALPWTLSNWLRTL